MAITQKEFAEQEITRLNSKTTKTPHEQKLLEHYQRILNPQPLSEEQRAEMEAERETLDLNDYAYPHEDDAQLTDWEEHVKTLDKNKPELIIEPNKFRFKNNKLTITEEQFPNLKLLYACGLGLAKVELDHEGLEGLYLISNQLSEIDFSGTPNLKNLVLSKNCIWKLRVKHLKQLEDLRCNDNCLLNLDVRGLTNLKKLDASLNYKNNLKLKKQREKVSRLRKVKFGNHPKLIDIDLGENAIENLNFPPLPALEMLSLRENEYPDDNFGNGEILTLRSRNLNTLDYYDSNITEVSHLLGLDNPNQLSVCNDETYRDSEGNYNKDASTEYEQKAYENQQKKEKEAFEEGNHVYEGQQHLDLSNCDFISSITIDGNLNYPQSLVSINLGGNCLAEVVVRNLPNLRRLIISHNKVKNLITENCPQLDLVYDYKSNDNERAVPINGRAYDDQRDNPIKQGEREKNEEENKILGQIIRLVAQAEAALAQGDYQAVAECLAELKQLAQQPIEGMNQDKLQAIINKFEQALASQPNTANHTKNYWPVVIIGSLFIIPIVLGLLVRLIKRRVKVKAPQSL